MNPPHPTIKTFPYYAQQTPRGSVVLCAAHMVSDELKPEEAAALVTALNDFYRSIGVGQ